MLMLNRTSLNEQKKYLLFLELLMGLIDKWVKSPTLKNPCHVPDWGLAPPLYCYMLQLWLNSNNVRYSFYRSVFCHRSYHLWAWKCYESVLPRYERHFIKIYLQNKTKQIQVDKELLFDIHISKSILIEKQTKNI